MELGDAVGGAAADFPAVFSQTSANAGPSPQHLPLVQSDGGHARQQFLATAAKEFVAVIAVAVRADVIIDVFAAGV